MNEIRLLHKVSKIVAISLLVITGIASAIIHPGFLDLLNGIAAGAATFVILRGPDMAKNADLADANEK
jgi:hypothetical protein